MAESLFTRMESLHERIKCQAAGSNAKYVMLLVMHIILAIVKRLAYCCWCTVQYFRRDDRILWFILYWIVFCSMLIKLKFSKVFLKHNTVP
jgi:hypothetical protein